MPCTYIYIYVCLVCVCTKRNSLGPEGGSMSVNKREKRSIRKSFKTFGYFRANGRYINNKQYKQSTSIWSSFRVAMLNVPRLLLACRICESLELLFESFLFLSNKARLSLSFWKQNQKPNCVDVEHTKQHISKLKRRRRQPTRTQTHDTFSFDS